MSNDRRATTVFLHIPKTAGSTVRTLLSQNYRKKRTHAFSGKPQQVDWFIEQPEKFRGSFDLIHGHHTYGIHEYVPRDCVYFTFLRNPVDRFFSDYFFAFDYPEHTLHDQIVSGEMSIVDYARLPEHEPYFDNLMTQYLVGRMFERPTSEDLALAKHRLENDIAAFGITERFDDSLLLIAQTLGWRKPFYMNKNISPKSIRDVPDEAIEHVKPFLQKDQQLYEFACELFERRVQAEGPELAAARQSLQEIEGRIHENYDRELHRLYSVGRRVGFKLAWANLFTGLRPIDALLKDKVHRAVYDFIASETR